MGVVKGMVNGCGQFVWSWAWSLVAVMGVVEEHGHGVVKRVVMGVVKGEVVDMVRGVF